MHIDVQELVLGIPNLFLAVLAFMTARYAVRGNNPVAPLMAWLPVPWLMLGLLRLGRAFDLWPTQTPPVWLGIVNICVGVIVIVGLTRAAKEVNRRIQRQRLAGVDAEVL